MGATGHISAADTKLLERLPRFFVPALHEQLAQWEVLFPAEQRLVRGQLDWLSALSHDQFDRLFAPVQAIEGQMHVSEWRLDARKSTIADTAALVRSPLYPQWRAQVERAFAEINAGVASSGVLRTANRFILTVLPPGLPVSSDPLWPAFSARGRWLRLEAPFGHGLEEFIVALARSGAYGRFDRVERMWVFECSQALSSAVAREPVNVLSFDGLKRLREALLSGLNTFSKSLRAADDRIEELRSMDLENLIPTPLNAEPRVREFVRTLLLSGNGALVYNNSFVQWGSSEALRRIQPVVLVSHFGIRARPKPFSAVVPFEDQHRSNPVLDEDDPEGSAIDGQILSEYVHLSGDRLAPYHQRTLGLLAAGDMDRVLITGPPGMPFLPNTARPLSVRELAEYALRWLES